MTQINPSKSRDKNKENSSRILVSFFILIFLVPLLVLSGPLTSWFVNSPNTIIVFQSIFFSTLMILIGLINYEFISNLIDKKTNRRTFIWALSTTTLISISVQVVAFLGLIDVIAMSSLLAISLMIIPSLIIVFLLLPSKYDLNDTIMISFILLLTNLFIYSLMYVNFTYSFIILGWILGMIVIQDIFAFVGGKAFGKTKFSETSPNKTIEGLATGVSLGILFGLLFGFLAIPALGGTNLENFILISSPYLIVATVLIAIIFAPLGDLFFSKVKRSMEIKDFSKMLKGHGGILDRIDSHIITLSLISLTYIIVYTCIN